MYFGDKDIKAILEESKKYDLIIFMASMHEAKEAAAEFTRKAGEAAEYVGDWTTCRTKEKNIIKFMTVGRICRGMDGYRGKVVFHIPQLEMISITCGGVCTLKQLVKNNE